MKKLIDFIKNIFLFSVFLIITIILSGCHREKMPQKQIIAEKKHAHGLLVKENELDFLVKNTTGDPIYITGFYYARKPSSINWSWYKTNVYRLSHNQITLIDIDTLPDEKERTQVYGYLGIFSDETDAETSTFELTDDRKRIPLKHLINLKNKMVVIEDREYGIEGQKLDFSIIDRPENTYIQKSELDFILENRTGKDLWTTTFVYQRESPAETIWDYEKTPVQLLENGESIFVDVDSIIPSENKKFAHAFVALFDIHEKKQAHAATFRLLPHEKRLDIGKLIKLQSKKVVIHSRPYGLRIDRKHRPLQDIYEASFEKISTQ